MRINSKLIATALAAALAIGSTTAPAAASGFGHGLPKFFFLKKAPKVVKVVKVSKSSSYVRSGGSSTAGKLIVGCIFGSALGLITASFAKGQAYNSKTVELTIDEAQAIALSCGLATFPVVANFQRNR